MMMMMMMIKSIEPNPVGHGIPGYVNISQLQMRSEKFDSNNNNNNNPNDVISHNVYSCHDFSQFDPHQKSISNSGRSVRLLKP